MHEIEKTLNEVLVGASRLMRPEEVRAATENNSGLGGPLSGWYLCGDASEAMVDAMAESGNVANIRLTGFVGPTGGHYAVITHQITGAQHRFLLPLYEPAVVEFLHALEHQSVQAMLGRRGQESAIVVRISVEWARIVPLLEMCQTAHDADAVTTFAEVRYAVAAVSQIETIPSLMRGVPVTDVSVSTVLPAEYCLAAIRKYGLPTEFKK